MNEPRQLRIPVILGTSRKGRASVHAATLLADLLNRRAGVCSEVIDIASLPLPVDDAGEAIKSAAFSAMVAAADGLVIVAPEYNHSFAGLLKHALDSLRRGRPPVGRGVHTAVRSLHPGTDLDVEGAAVRPRAGDD